MAKSKTSEKLFLTIKKEWFNMILSGEKLEEYRDITPFFDSRLNKKYASVIFQNGYNKTSPRVELEFLGVEKKNANPSWSAGYGGFCYVIKLGKIIKYQPNGKEEIIKEVR
jgi:hypothetical protein